MACCLLRNNNGATRTRSGIAQNPGHGRAWRHRLGDLQFHLFGDGVYVWIGRETFPLAILKRELVAGLRDSRERKVGGSTLHDLLDWKFWKRP